MILDFGVLTLTGRDISRRFNWGSLGIATDSPYSALLVSCHHMFCTNLRIYRGQRFYADSGKRYRDQSNRIRAGVKCLGDITGKMDLR